MMIIILIIIINIISDYQLISKMMDVSLLITNQLMINYCQRAWISLFHYHQLIHSHLIYSKNLDHLFLCQFVNNKPGIILTQMMIKKIHFNLWGLPDTRLSINQNTINDNLQKEWWEIVNMNSVSSLVILRWQRLTKRWR